MDPNVTFLLFAARLNCCVKDIAGDFKRFCIVVLNFCTFVHCSCVFLAKKFVAFVNCAAKLQPVVNASCPY